MALILKKISCKTILPGCVKASTIIPGRVKAKKPSPVPKVDVSEPQVLLQRLSFSDFSKVISLNVLPKLLVGISDLQVFTHQELEVMTNKFSRDKFLGRGGFGKVYKGFIDDKLRPGLEAQPVAVKVLDLNGCQGHNEWLREVIFLGQFKHPHLVKLIGYCCEDEHRLLVYEYMPGGNLEKKLFETYSAPLPWITRIKIAVGTAKCLAFLHEEVKPVIYRDFKPSNILLDKDYTAKLSDFGLEKYGPQGDDTDISTRVMGTHGYAAPEYIQTRRLTTKCNVYSFGVVLLELLTGKRVLDNNRRRKVRVLVKWARPLLKDFKKLEEIMDPRLEGQYSTNGIKKADALAYRCLSDKPKSRPTMRTMVKTLEPLLKLNDILMGPFVCTVSPGGNISLSYVQNNDEKGEEEKEEKEKEEEERKEDNGGHYLLVCMP